MSSGLVYLRPMRLAFVRTIGPYEQSIPEAWKTLFAWISKNDLNAPVGRGYGLAHDNPAKVASKHLRYDACVQLTPMFEDRAIRELSVMTLPSGPYLRQRYAGDYQGVCKLVASAHESMEMPSDLRLDVRRPLVTIYLDDPARLADGDLRADVCLPVAVASGRDKASAA
ncbi:MAG: AraC family transcriptional regulator [Hyphomicrobium sp.]